jgi:hypothetical protein
MGVRFFVGVLKVYSIAFALPFKNENSFILRGESYE